MSDGFWMLKLTVQFGLGSFLAVIFIGIGLLVDAFVFRAAGFL